MTAYAKTYPIQAAAKKIGIGSKQLFAFLREQHFIDETNVAYKQYVDEGFFKVQNGSWEHPSTLEKQYYKRTYITFIGVDWLSKLIEKKNEH